jgi:extracellular factor (EF) 3-hydroxypalmitic acid methyl ester biosynthesis protein
VLQAETRLIPALEAYEQRRYGEAVELSGSVLSQMRNESAANWPEIVQHLRKTELFRLAQMCSFTRHSFSKPRGYAGDALLLDWIYKDFRINLRPDLKSESAALYRYTNSRAPTTAVRWRKEHLANLIDDSGFLTPHARVLSIACGHLREVDSSLAVQQGLIAELEALDQDGESLEEVSRSYTSKGLPVTPVHASIRDVILGKQSLGGFDLMYSAGLFDYLEEKVAKKLAATLFDALNPGGSLLLTNFLLDTPDIGWTESMMDWYLIYRSQQEIEAFADSIPRTQIAHMRSYRCPTGSIGYVAVRKK